MQIQELRALKLQHLKQDIDCLNKRYRDLDIDNLGDLFVLRCKAQNIANTILEVETLEEFRIKNKEVD